MHHVDDGGDDEQGDGAQVSGDADAARVGGALAAQQAVADQKLGDLSQEGHRGEVVGVPVAALAGRGEQALRAGQRRQQARHQQRAGGQRRARHGAPLSLLLASAGGGVGMLASNNQRAAAPPAAVPVKRRQRPPACCAPATAGAYGSVRRCWHVRGKVRVGGWAGWEPARLRERAGRRARQVRRRRSSRGPISTGAEHFDVNVSSETAPGARCCARASFFLKTIAALRALLAPPQSLLAPFALCTPILPLQQLRTSCRRKQPACSRSQALAAALRRPLHRWPTCAATAARRTR